MQLYVNVTVNWIFSCLQLICCTFLYECITKLKNYVQNIRRCYTGFGSSCGKVPRICVRPQKTRVLIVRN